MKQRIEKYIPKAIELIKDVEIADKGEVSNEFNGYFSSFGAAIIQSGLKPALAFFSNENSSSQKDRAKIVKAVYIILKDVEEENITKNTLLEHVISLNGREENIKTKIIDASIALKLAVRTYKLVKK